IVFAGYGLKQDRYGYDDFGNIVTEDKIVLVMMGCPPAADGDGYMVEGVDWSSFQSLQVKLTPLLFTRAKAVLIVPDPKSGYLSLEEQFPGISGELNSAISMKGQKPRIMQMPNMPKIMIVHRDIADELLKGSSYDLSGLQKKIDETGKPFSIEIPDKKVKITEVVKTEDMHLNNVAAYIEGSDPVLKNEFIVYSAHIDHIGVSSRGVNTGADDNASGCAGLLSIAEAFQNLKKKPLRSALFLWVSGEEIGLLGSRYYVNNPLVPLENTLVNLNADMIGRVKGPADTTADNPMTGPKEVFVISDNQSKELTTIAEAVDQQSVLDFNFSLSGRKHPLQLFSRSDHYNFVVKDIPVLFFFTGLHTDYHSPEDVVEKINFEKMELIAETMFQIGYEVANKKKRIVVDNPFSSW
ncbi:MAG TPA: M28 family peptidase, partial [Bacteroidales bacterium]|nr:M28 family peptidase [Bacteroidales bacterium]